MMLVDTDTWVWAMRGHHAVRAALRRHSPDDVAIASMTVAELWYGVWKRGNVPSEHDKVARFLASIPTVLSFDVAAAERHARLRFDLREQPIGGRDLIIGSTALANNLALVTSNTREFSRVPGLVLEDWTRP